MHPLKTKQVIKNVSYRQTIADVRGYSPRANPNSSRITPENRVEFSLGGQGGHLTTESK